MNNTIVGDTTWLVSEKSILGLGVDTPRIINNIVTGLVIVGGVVSLGISKRNQFFPLTQNAWDSTIMSTSGKAYMPYDVYDTLDFRPRPETYGRNNGDTVWLPRDVADLDEDGDTTERLDFDIDMNPRISGSTVDIGAYEYFEGYADTVLQEICVGDSILWEGDWRSGNRNFVKSFSLGAGGDSALRLQLRHDSINKSINPSPWGDYFTSNEVDSGSTYQWIDCFFKDSIPGATSPTFVPTINGRYQVIITNRNGCVDTSQCVNLVNIGIEENAIEYSLTPNPASNEVQLVATHLRENQSISYQLFSSSGQLMQSGKLRAPDALTISVASLKKGIYILRLDNSQPLRLAVE